MLEINNVLLSETLSWVCLSPSRYEERKFPLSPLWRPLVEALKTGPLHFSIPAGNVASGSYSPTQLSHRLQWEARGGRKILQVKQYFSFTVWPLMMTSLVLGGGRYPPELVPLAISMERRKNSTHLQNTISAPWSLSPDSGTKSSCGQHSWGSSHTSLLCVVMCKCCLVETLAESVHEGQRPYNGALVKGLRGYVVLLIKGCSPWGHAPPSSSGHR